MEFSTKSPAAAHFSELPPEILLSITSFADPEACLSLIQTCHRLYGLTYSRTFWINLSQNLRLRRPLPVDETVEDLTRIQAAALHALRLHNKWEDKSDYHPSHWRILSPPSPSLRTNLDTACDVYVWFADKDTLVHGIDGMVHWRDAHSGALLTSFHMMHYFLGADTCFINGELFIAVGLQENPEEHSRSLIQIWRSGHPEDPVWEMGVAGQVNLSIYNQHAIFLVTDAPVSLVARIVSLADMQHWVVPIHFEVKGGPLRVKRDVENAQFVFHHSLDDRIFMDTLRYETLLAHRMYDEAITGISPKQLLCLTYSHGAIQQETAWATKISTSWDGGRLILWRTWTTDYEQDRLIASVHDISGPGPSDIPVTPTQACPDEYILLDVPLNVLEDNQGYRKQHMGPSGKAMAWVTVESTVMLLEVPPSGGRGVDREKNMVRPLHIPSSVGLEHHGQVMDIELDDSRGRVILAMQDETLIIFEFA